LQRVDGERPGRDRCRQQHEDLGHVAAKEIKDRLADVVEDDAALLDGRGHSLEPVILQDDR
jgi:hypothetical protein